VRAIIKTVVATQPSPKPKEETCGNRSLPALVYISPPASHNTHDLFQIVAASVVNAAALRFIKI
jgi:hypothetical protein